VVDEVLAVGDAEFQKKAIGKMKEVSAGGGRTVLFVSHNMASINTLCSSAIFMENGTIKEIGNTGIIIKRYLTDSNINSKERTFDYKHDYFELKKIKVSNANPNESEIYRDKDIYLKFQFENKSVSGLTYFNLKFKSEAGEYFMVTTSDYPGFVLEFTDSEAKMVVPAGFFNEGTYLIELMILNYSDSRGYSTYFHDTEFLQLDILPEKRPIGAWMGREVGQIRHTFQWTK